MVISAFFRLFGAGATGEYSFSKMGKYGFHVYSLLLVLACASSKTIAYKDGIFQDFINGISNTSEIAVVVDLSDGNVEKVKEAWSTFDAKYDGEVTLGVIDGSGYETTTNFDDLKEVGPTLRDLEPSVKPNASSSDLFRFLLKTMSLLAPESRVLLFTGRTAEEGPLHRACMEKLREKRTRLYVIWTGSSFGGTYALRHLTDASNGSLSLVGDVVEQNSTEEEEEEEETSIEVAVKPVLLSRILSPSNPSNSDKTLSEITIEDDDNETIKKFQRVKFPEPKLEETAHLSQNTHSTNLSMEQQQSRSAVFVPIRVEVSSKSMLESRPGNQQQIQYDVKNNLNRLVALNFLTLQPQNLIVTNIQPQWQMLQPLQKTKVDVTFQASPTVTEGGEGSLEFAAKTEFGSMTRLPTTITFTSTGRHDTTDPEVTYTYLGDCRGHDKPNTCENGEWSFRATFQDDTSGLKKVLSEPYGLIFQSPFSAGTKSPVTVSYTASCCQPRIDIWAENGKGNYVKRSLDVNNQGLLAGEIAAIVLGVLLLICVIIGIIVTIVIVKKRKQNKLIIPRYQGNN